MKKLGLFFIGIVALASVAFALPTNITKAPVGTVYNHPTGYVPQLNAPTEVLITHSTNQTITSENSVACRYSSGYHTDNSYFRVFNLQDDFSINKDFNVTHLEIGIELAHAASGFQPVTVRLHTLNGVMANANLSLLYSETFSVPDQTLSIYDFEFATPVLVPSGEVLVVEVFTPDGFSAGNDFFIGSNTTATTSPSYLAAASCAITEPATIASIGFPQMNIVMNVYGVNAVVPVPYGYIAGVFLLIAIAFVVRKRLF
jgi:hypothetical protein